MCLNGPSAGKRSVAVVCSTRDYCSSDRVEPLPRVELPPRESFFRGSHFTWCHPANPHAFLSWDETLFLATQHIRWRVLCYCIISVFLSFFLSTQEQRLNIAGKITRERSEFLCRLIETPKWKKMDIVLDLADEYLFTPYIYPYIPRTG